MDTFKVGDAALVISAGENPKSQYLVGASVTVDKALYHDPDSRVNPVVGIERDGRLWSAHPRHLMKITPPPDFVDEDERDELTA